MKSHAKNNQRRGVVLIEAALVFPILLLLTFGLMEYGWLFLRMETVFLEQSEKLQLQR